MAVIFVGNRAADFVTGLIDNTSSANNARDTAYSPTSLQFISSDTINPILLPIFNPVPNSAMWFHYRYQYGGGSGNLGNVTGVLWSMYTATGALLAQCDLNFGNFRTIVYGDSTTTGPNYLTMPTTISTFIMDVKLTVTASLITVETYINGVLVDTRTAVNTVGNKPYPSRFVFDNDDSTAGNGSNSSISEVIVTDGNESTIGWRLHTWTPNAVGFYSQWLGDYESIINPIDGRFLIADQTGIRESWTFISYAGPTTPASIRGVYARIDASKGVSGPQTIVPFLRLGGVDYEATGIVPSDGITSMTEWALNPATAAPWATANFTGIELGVRSAT